MSELIGASLIEPGGGGLAATAVDAGTASAAAARAAITERNDAILCRTNGRTPTACLDLVAGPASRRIVDGKDPTADSVRNGEASLDQAKERA